MSDAVSVIIVYIAPVRIALNPSDPIDTTLNRNMYSPLCERAMILNGVEKKNEFLLELRGYIPNSKSTHEERITTGVGTQRLITRIEMAKRDQDNNRGRSYRSLQGIVGLNKTIGEAYKTMFTWLLNLLALMIKPMQGEKELEFKTEEEEAIQNALPAVVETPPEVIDLPTEKGQSKFSSAFIITIQSKSNKKKVHTGTPIKYDFPSDRLTIIRKDGAAITVKSPNNFIIKYIKVKICTFKTFKKTYSESSDSQKMAINAVRYRIEKEELKEKAKGKEDKEETSETSTYKDNENAQALEQWNGLYGGIDLQYRRNAYKNDYQIYSISNCNGPLFMEKL